MNKLLILLALIHTTAAVPAIARDNNHIDYAEVVDVNPIYKTVEHRVPERQCWTETVAYSRPQRGHRSHTGTILGTIIGAAIGNEVGHSKRNKKVGAAAGAILGASIARDISYKSSRYDDDVAEYRDQQRCEVSHSVEYEQRLLGYDVTYQYQGLTYHTRMGEHPGKKIKVAVQVRPVH